MGPTVKLVCRWGSYGACPCYSSGPPFLVNEITGNSYFTVPVSPNIVSADYKGALMDNMWSL